VINFAKCPKCDELISNVHYESHTPNPHVGYRGSRSFTAVAHPCGHALGAVPVTWEIRLEELDKSNKELHKKIDELARVIFDIASFVKNNWKLK